MKWEDKRITVECQSISLLRDYSVVIFTTKFSSCSLFGVPPRKQFSTARRCWRWRLSRVIPVRFFASIPAIRVRGEFARERAESILPARTVRTIRFPRHSLQYRIKANCCAYRPSGPLSHACGLQMSDGGSQLRKIMTSVTQSRLRLRVCVTPSFRDGRPSPSDPELPPTRFNRVRGSERGLSLRFLCIRARACVGFFATFGLFQRCD